jgi:argininosuccinate lyase
VLGFAESQGTTIAELPLSRLQSFSPAFGDDLKQAITVATALSKRAVEGGTAPKAVRAALKAFQERRAELEKGIESSEGRK